MQLGIEIDRRQVEEYCRKWKIAELAFFGSVLRDDFRPDSDVDVLIRFASEAHWSLFDFVGAENELSEILGRKAHLADRSGIEESQNWIRRKAILSDAKPFYVARASRP